MSPREEIELLTRFAGSLDTEIQEAAKRRLERIAEDPSVAFKLRAKAWVARAMLGFACPRSAADETGGAFIERARAVDPQCQPALLWLLDDALAPMPPAPDRVRAALAALSEAAATDGLDADEELRGWLRLELDKARGVADAGVSALVERLSRLVSSPG